MASTTLALLGGLSAIGSLGGAAIGASAAKTAASEQEQAANNALGFQESTFNTEQQNQAPYLAAGQTSLSQLMAGLSSGKFGAGSVPSFTAPTLAQAEQMPGYQFTAQQGSKGILEGSAAAGGAISGGTLKALDQYNSNLASTSYNTLFGQALNGYQANLGAQQQEYNQLLAPAQLGEGATQNINSSGQSAALNVGNLMTQQGNAAAAGTVGAANAITSGLTGATNSLTQTQLLSQLLNPSSASTAPGTGAALLLPAAGVPNIPSQTYSYTPGEGPG